MENIIEEKICEHCEDTGIAIKGNFEDSWEEKCICTIDPDSDYDNERDNNL